MREAKIGGYVFFVDERAVRRPALVTQVWKSMGGHGADGVNVVFVNPDDSHSDQYGRQIERKTSVTHMSQQPAHGWYWRGIDEVGKETEVDA